MAQPRVSVVTPTYNRRDRLGRTLSALDAQTVPAGTFEVVVVDDGSKDGTAEWLAGQRYAFPLQILRQENSGPARARNAGILAAKGELVLFLDDDVVPEPQLLEEHLRSHDAESAELVVIGPLASLPYYSQPWVAWEQVKVEAQYTAMIRGDFAPSFRQFWTGNASVARAHLVGAGLFDTTFLRGEDVELGYRLHQRGLQFRFNPKARGLHHAERSLESWMNAHKSYGRLEVQIFGQGGDDFLNARLSENFARLHAGTRWLTRRAVETPLLHSATTHLLRRFLESKGAARAPFAANKACSVLANLLYWGACNEALGKPRFDDILRRAAEVRDA